MNLRPWIILALGLGSVCGLPAVTRPAAPASHSSPKWVFNLLPRSMQRRPQIDIWVVTEHTPLGLQLRTPSPENPLHYVAQSGGCHSLGASVFERPPKAQALQRVLVSALRAEGLEPTDAQNPANVLLVYTWGSHHRDVILGAPVRHGSASLWSNYDRNPAPYHESHDYLRSKSDDDARSLLGPPPQPGYPPPMPALDYVEWTEDRPAPMPKSDMIERAALLVGDGFARQFRDDARSLPEDTQAFGPAMRTLQRMALEHPRGRFLAATLRDSLYFVVVTAYDLAGVGRGRRDVLWRTKIAVTADGISAVETMPGLLVAAAPHMGRENADGVLLHRRIDRRGNVVLGEPETIGWETGEGPAASRRAEGRR